MSSSAQSPSGARSFLWALLPLVAALATHFNTLPGDFVLGDRILVEKREEMRDLDLQRIFFLDYWSPRRLDNDFRPLTFLTYALNYRLGGGALSFHAINFGLNAAVALLAYFLLLELLQDAVFAALGSALYAVLPIRTDAVASILGRAEILAGLALLGAWLLALKNSPTTLPKRERPGLVLAAGALVFLGLFARENAVTVAPFLILTASWALRRPVPWMTVATTASAVASYFAIRETILEGKPNPILFSENPLVYADFGTRALNSLRLLGLYLWKTVAPMHLAADYSSNQLQAFPWSDFRLWISAAGTALFLFLAAFFSWRRFPLAVLSVFFFLLIMAPAVNPLFPMKAIFSEKLAYASSLAFPLALCALLQAAPRERRKLSLGFLCTLLLIYGARSLARNQDWSTQLTMEQSLARGAAPTWIQLRAADESLSLCQKATTGTEKKELLEKSRVELEQVLRVDPENSCAVVLFGEVKFREAQRLFLEGNYASAVTCLTEALGHSTKLGPPEFEPLVLQLRGECYLRMGKVPETFKDLDDAIKLLETLGRTPNALLRNYRGLTLAQQGKLEEALKDFNSALALRPDLPELWNNRGFCRFKLDDLAGAIEDYKEGLKLAQNNGAIYSPTGDTVWSFLIKMSSVYRKAARIQRASGNEEAGKLAEAQAAGLEAEAQKLLPPKAQ